MAVKRRRVGLVGAGWVTAYHLPAWHKQTHRVDLVAIADPSPAAARQRAEAFGIAATYLDAAHMLAAERLDIVDIAAPRDYHAELVAMAAAQSIDILCQKPLATTYDAAQGLVAGLPAGPRLMVHENWRFRSWYRRLKQWLDDDLPATYGRSASISCPAA